VKKLVMFSLLATSLLAAPAVQAQMRHGAGVGHRGPLVHSRGGWSGNHVHRQAQRFRYRNHQRFDTRGFRGNRNNYHTARYWGWGRGQHRGFAQNHRPRGWTHNNYRRRYQTRGYEHYRQPYRPSAYGYRAGFHRGSRPAYGPGAQNHQNYGYNRPADTYRSGAGTYNGRRPNFGHSGITRTAVTSSQPTGHGIGTWSHGSSRASSGTWSGHTNSRFSSETRSGGVSAPVVSD
jgi:hypothetical protein